MKKIFTPAFLGIAGFFLLSPDMLRAQVWRPIASIPNNACCYYDTSRSAPVLTLGPTGIPYLLYQDYVNPSANSVIVTAYIDSAWAPVGNQDFAPSYMGFPDIHVASNNTVYTGLNGGGSQPDAYAYSGGAWAQVGVPQTAPVNSTATPVSITTDAAGTPWYAIYNTLTGSPSVYTYSSGAWVETGPGTLGNGGGGTFVQLAFDYHNTPYIAYDETNASGPAPYLVVEKYSGGAWTRMGTTTLYSIGANHILTFDDLSTPYVIDNDPTNANSFKLMKFTGSDWVQDGPVVAATSSVQVSANHITQLYLAMGQHNTPQICYWSTTYDPAAFGYPVAFVKLDSSSWVPAADTTIAIEASGSNSIAFTADTLGHAFLAYTYFDAINPDIHAFQLIQNKKPVITFNPIDTVYGTPDFSPGASSTNTDPGDPITYTIADTTIARIVNGKIHILNAGNTTITASQAADSNWLAGGPVQVQLDILVATQTISFPGWPQKKVGDPDFAAGGFASSGLPVTYDGSDPTIATVSPNGTIHIIEQGAIIVTAHQTGNNNYLAAPDVAQVLIINGADSTDSTGSGSPGRGKGKIIAYCNSRSSLLVQVTPPVDGPALLEVYNSFGWRIYSKEINLSVKGGDTFLVPVGELPGGIYYVRVKGNGYNLIQSIWIK